MRFVVTIHAGTEQSFELDAPTPDEAVEIARDMVESYEISIYDPIAEMTISIESEDGYPYLEGVTFDVCI